MFVESLRLAVAEEVSCQSCSNVCITGDLMYRLAMFIGNEKITLCQRCAEELDRNLHFAVTLNNKSKEKRLRKKSIFGI